MNGFSQTIGKRILFLLALGYCAIHLYYLDKYPTPWFDEYYYTEPSWRFLTEKSFRTTLYPDIGHMGTSSVLHGRIFLFINLLIFYLCDYTLFAMRLQSFLMGLCTLFLTYMATRNMFSSKSAGWIAAALLSISTLFVQGSHMGRAEMSIACLTMLTLFLLTKAKEMSPFIYFSTGLVAALALDCHIPSGIVALGGFILVLFYRFLKFRNQNTAGHWKMLIFAFLGISVGLVWWVGVHILPHPKIFFEQIKVRSQETQPMVKRSKFLFKQEFNRYKHFFWEGRYHRNMLILFFLVLSIIFMVRRRNQMPYLEILLFFFGGLAALALISGTTPLYYLMGFYPMFCILIGVFLSDFTQSANLNRKRLGFIFCLTLLLFYVVENSYWLYHFRKADYQGYLKKIKEVIPENSIVMAPPPIWPAFKDGRCYTDFYIAVWDQLPEMKKYGKNYEELFDSLKVEYYIDDENVYPWEQQKELIDFMNRRTRMIATVEDNIYGRTTFYPGVKKTYVYKVLPKKA